MEQHKQTHVELSEEELQKVTGGDNKTVGATIGTGIATIASIGAGTYYIGQQVKKVGDNVAVTRATAETGLAYSRGIPGIARAILHR